MDGRIDNIAHASAAVIGVALEQLDRTGTVTDSVRNLLIQARESLRSLCPECSSE